MYTRVQEAAYTDVLMHHLESVMIVLPCLDLCKDVVFLGFTEVCKAGLMCLLNCVFIFQGSEE